MTDDQTKLLTEIRDTTREHLELYRQQAEFHRATFEDQKKENAAAVVRSKRAMRILFAVFFALVFVGYASLSGAIDRLSKNFNEHFPEFVIPEDKPQAGSR